MLEQTERKIVIAFPKVISIFIGVALIGWTLAVLLFVLYIVDTNRIKNEAEREASVLVAKLTIASYIRGAVDLAELTRLNKWKKPSEIERMIKVMTEANLSNGIVSSSYMNLSNFIREVERDTERFIEKGF